MTTTCVDFIPRFVSICAAKHEMCINLYEFTHYVSARKREKNMACLTHFLWASVIYIWVYLYYRKKGEESQSTGRNVVRIIVTKSKKNRKCAFHDIFPSHLLETTSKSATWRSATGLSGSLPLTRLEIRIKSLPIFMAVGNNETNLADRYVRRAGGIFVRF